MSPIRKAVIPVAGMGTRFLPVTKAQPKEMLPLVDKPVIQHVVEEAIRNGIQSIILVTGRGKQAIENHFDVAYELEDMLSRRGNQEALELVKAITHLAQFAYVRQGEPLGLGHAVLCAQHAVGDGALRPAAGGRCLRRGRPRPGCAHRRLRGHRQLRGGGAAGAARPGLPLRHRQCAADRPAPGGTCNRSSRNPRRRRLPATGRWWDATSSRPASSSTCST